MEKYLKTSVLKRRLQSRKFRGKNLDEHELSLNDGIDEALYLLEKMKSANVKSKIVAEWVYLGGDEWGCSNCGHIVTTGFEHPTSIGFCNDFCCHCGAEMLKEECG